MPKDTTDLDPRISQLLHRVEKGLVHAAHVDDVFWQVQAIFRANEALAVDGGTLQDWLGRLYVDSVTIALRRQADQRKGVVSLWRLLEMMKGAAPVLTRARYVELHDNDVHHRRAAASHWDRVVAPGHDGIPRPLLKAKQDELRSALSHVSRYANEYVAHCGRRSSRREDDVRGCAARDGHRLQGVSLVLSSADRRRILDAGSGNPASVASSVPDSVARAGSAGAGVSLA